MCFICILIRVFFQRWLKSLKISKERTNLTLHNECDITLSERTHEKYLAQMSINMDKKKNVKNVCSIAKVTHDWSACFCFQWKIHSCYNSHTTIRELRLKELHQYKRNTKGKQINAQI